LFPMAGASMVVVPVPCVFSSDIMTPEIWAASFEPRASSKPAVVGSGLDRMLLARGTKLVARS
jgi:hypothetical protein